MSYKAILKKCGKQEICFICVLFYRFIKKDMRNLLLVEKFSQSNRAVGIMLRRQCGRTMSYLFHLYEEILTVLSCFCSSVSSLPLGFLVGILTVTFVGLCPKNPVSCHKVIPVGKCNGCSPAIFLSWTCPSKVLDKHKIRLSGLQSRLFFSLWVFFNTVTWFLPVRI